MKKFSQSLIVIVIILILTTTSIADGFLKGVVGVKETDKSVSHLLCGDKLCSEIKDAKYPPPLKQLKAGIPLEEIKCNEGKNLIFKDNRKSPACVSFDTESKLLKRGWVLLRLSLPDFGISITPDFQNGKRFLNFDGFGWHRLHNVEITISNEREFSTMLLSKTTDRGDLMMPWIVPDSANAGLYHVVATDGIHTFEIDIPITSP